MTGPIVAVVGLKREARIVGMRATVCQRGLGVDEALRQGGAAVISFGLCGALEPGWAVGDLVIGEAVVDGPHRFECDRAWTASLAAALPNARRGLFWADGKMITSMERKAQLHMETGAAAADMESHMAGSAAAEFGVPFTIVRAVSDDSLTAIPRAAQAGFAEDGSIKPLAVVFGLLNNYPDQTIELITLARNAGRAFKRLEAAAPSIFQIRP